MKGKNPGGIITRYKAHWDSQKEYEEFWNRGKVQSPDQKKNTRRKRPWVLLVLLFAVILVSAAAWLLFPDKAVEKAPAGIGSNASYSIVDSSPDSIPEYSGKDIIEINGGIPCFTDYDLTSITGEHYTELDGLGRCGTAVAMLDCTMMPNVKRGFIGDVRPSGWVQKKYPGIVDSEPPYLYNRCHLIAYAMTGQNANELNLITGTRYLNEDSMLPYEKKVLRYLDHSDHHVLYRVSPYFKDNELVTRGVEIEAYSVEDNGEGVSFHVFVYNIQPGIEIDYKTGNSWIQEHEG